MQLIATGQRCQLWCLQGPPLTGVIICADAATVCLDTEQGQILVRKANIAAIEPEPLLSPTQRRRARRRKQARAHQQRPPFKPSH